jgi:hypothetical protein
LALVIKPSFELLGSDHDLGRRTRLVGIAVCRFEDEREAESGHAAALREADWLCFAAAATFAIALLMGVPGGGQADIL